MPLSPEEQNKFQTRYYAALDSFPRGEATRDTWQALADAINMTKSMCTAGLGDAYLDMVESAIDALSACRDRFKRTQRWGMTGDEISAIRDALRLVNAQYSTVTLRELGYDSLDIERGTIMARGKGKSLLCVAEGNWLRFGENGSFKIMRPDEAATYVPIQIDDDLRAENAALRTANGDLQSWFDAAKSELDALKSQKPIGCVVTRALQGHESIPSTNIQWYVPHVSGDYSHAPYRQSQKATLLCQLSQLTRCFLTQMKYA
ncbi:MAG: hypothetical protein Q8L80_08015 [Gallionella sp.]|nr:hypothetical protein [Gallionella sp.]MDP1941244.1 hypothetical protein [Gallionella sp.]